MEVIQTCYICREWYDEKVLSKIKIPDQTGYVEKPICVKCLKEIEERSQRSGDHGDTVYLHGDKGEDF